MRLKEEKTLIAIEIVGLLFIILSTFVIEVADYNINQWTSRILLLQSELNDISNSEIITLINSDFMSLMQILKADSEPYGEQDYLVDKKYVKKELAEPWEDLKNKKITLQEYILKIREPVTKRHFELGNMYHHKKEEIDNELRDQPQLKIYKFNVQWNLIRGFFNSIRILALAISALLYLFLYLSIAQRFKK